MLSGEGGFIINTKNQPFPEMINFRERLFPQLVGWKNKKIFIWYVQIEWINYIIFFHDLSIKLLVEFCRYQKTSFSKCIPSRNISKKAGFWDYFIVFCRVIQKFYWKRMNRWSRPSYTISVLKLRIRKKITDNDWLLRRNLI